MYILAYDINPKNPPHGLRVKLVRALRRNNAIQLQRSLWILPNISKNVLTVVDEVKRNKNLVVFSRFKPIYPFPIKHVGIIIPHTHSTLTVLHLLRKIAEILASEGITADVHFSGRGSLLSATLDEVCMKVDAVIFIMKSKNVKKGIYHGGIIYEASNFIKLFGIPLFQILYVEKNEKPTLVVWNKDLDNQFCRKLSEKLSLEVVNGFVVPKRVWKRGKLVYRRVLGVIPGEEIIINDVPVAKAEREEVILVAHKGKIVDAVGARPYKSLKDLKVKLEKALIKSV
ncbi:MAG: DUF2117 domain-containing protein [Candidatus Bathyarchaeota archaeon]|nr:DUF2117 domain-containing protein [Candidatus Bathyarchaeota archaeon]